MARWLVIATLACGCRQLWGLGDTPGRTIGDDAPPDVPADMTAGPCYGTFGNAPYCSDAPLPSFDPSITSIDTDTDARCLARYGGECVIAARTIDINQHLTATGKRPLVLIATDSFQLRPSGMIDVGSHQGSLGAGYTGNATDCLAGIVPGSTAGGAGGSFGGSGGNGGNGTIGTGGTPGPIASSPTKLRGGCAGQNGSGGGAGGAGGGVLYLISTSQLRIDGDLDASGTGGRGALAQVHGGGGGGSGGMIVLEAPSFEVHGRVYASGGGGGEGSSDIDGHAGADPTGLQGALGGMGASGGAGDGGNGSGFAMPGGNAGSPSSLEGGGGGGGGAGVIKAIGGVVIDLTSFAPEPT